MHIFRGGSKHGWAPNIDIFYRVFEAAVEVGDGLFEGVQIHAYQIDALQAVFLHGGFVSIIVAPIQEASVNLWVQGFDSAIQHLGEAGKFTDVYDWDACFANSAGGAAGGEKFYTLLVERSGEINDSVFVGYA